jgi:hypothetical protein
MALAAAHLLRNTAPLLDLRLGLKSIKILGHCTLLTMREGPVQLKSPEI